jgi:hypothetical protein
MRAWVSRAMGHSCGPSLFPRRSKRVVITPTPRASQHYNAVAWIPLRWSRKYMADGNRRLPGGGANPNAAVFTPGGGYGYNQQGPPRGAPPPPGYGQPPGFAPPPVRGATWPSHEAQYGQQYGQYGGGQYNQPPPPHRSGLSISSTCPLGPRVYCGNGELNPVRSGFFKAPYARTRRRSSNALRVNCARVLARISIPFDT